MKERGTGEPVPQGVAGPNQLKMLAQELDEYCAAHGIFAGPDREAIASLILGLFHAGYRTVDEIKAALEENDTWRWLRQG